METITLPIGTKLKIDGERVATVAETVVDVATMEARPSQANPWKAYVCPDLVCQEFQKSINRGHLIVARMNGTATAPRWRGQVIDNAVTCRCGVNECNTRMVPQDDNEGTA